MLVLPAWLLRALHGLSWATLHAWLLQSKRVHAGQHGHSMKYCSSNVYMDLMRRSWSRRGKTAARPPDALGYVSPSRSDVLAEELMLSSRSAAAHSRRVAQLLYYYTSGRCEGVRSGALLELVGSSRVS